MDNIYDLYVFDLPFKNEKSRNDDEDERKSDKN